VANESESNVHRNNAILIGRAKNALQIITQYGQIQGDHHSKWVIDQVTRALLGGQYNEWRARMKERDGDEYDEGIAP